MSGGEITQMGHRFESHLGIKLGAVFAILFNVFSLLMTQLAQSRARLIDSITKPRGVGENTGKVSV